MNIFLDSKTEVVEKYGKAIKSLDNRIAKIRFFEVDERIRMTRISDMLKKDVLGVNNLAKLNPNSINERNKMKEQLDGYNNSIT